MKNKFIEFIKKEKNFIFGILYFIMSEVFVVYHTKIFEIYQIEIVHKILIFILIYFEIEFCKKGIGLLFPKVKHRE